MFCYIIFFLDIFGMNIWIVKLVVSQWKGLAVMDPFIKLPFLLSLSSQYGWPNMISPFLPSLPMEGEKQPHP